MSFGADVMAERKRLKMSRVKFAELVRLKGSQINSIEREFRDPRPEEIEALMPFIDGTHDGATGPLPLPESPYAPVVMDTAPGEIDALTEDEIEANEQLQLFDEVLSFPTPEYGRYKPPPPDPGIAPVAPDGVRRMTHGEFSTFKRCRRKWWLSYYRQLGLPQEQVVGAAPLGTRIHKALAAYYNPEIPFDQAGAWEVLEQTIKDDTYTLEDIGWADKLDEMKKEAELARIMLEGYFEWVEATGADEGLTIVASEQPLEVESGVPGVRLLGKLDLRVHRESDGARLFLDHKTVGNFTQPTQWLHLREQPKHYLLLEFLDLKASGQEEERSIGAVWNMLRKVKRTATAKPPFYERVEVFHNIESLRTYWQHIVSGLAAMEGLRDQLDSGMDHHAVAYPTPTGDCVWDCDFFHICSMFDDGSRVEQFVKNNLVTINPLKRYEPEGT